MAKSTSNGFIHGPQIAPVPTPGFGSNAKGAVLNGEPVANMPKRSGPSMVPEVTRLGNMGGSIPNPSIDTSDTNHITNEGE